VALLELLSGELVWVEAIIEGIGISSQFMLLLEN
jgi:hypothetical protein